jgi:hypothetical protein
MIALNELGEFRLKDQDAWDKCVANNKDPYGGRIVEYAEQWARLMQKQMDDGKKLVDVADKMAKRADYDGITGFMYGAAVSILSKVWEHGETLRQWHNLDTQIGTEGEKANKSGGVLNLALLSIGEKQ